MKPLDRLRLGWRALESKTAKNWLIELPGPEVYRVVWEPLLIGKFGALISAVWFWNQIALRGDSRGMGGAETLAYFSGGFGMLVNALKTQIENMGGEILTGHHVTRLTVEDGRVTMLTAGGKTFAIIATPALPILADLLESNVVHDACERLRAINYLGSVCLVLELDGSL